MCDCPQLLLPSTTPCSRSSASLLPRLCRFCLVVLFLSLILRFCLGCHRLSFFFLLPASLASFILLSADLVYVVTLLLSGRSTLFLGAVLFGGISCSYRCSESSLFCSLSVSASSISFFFTVVLYWVMASFSAFPFGGGSCLRGLYFFVLLLSDVIGASDLFSTVFIFLPFVCVFPCILACPVLACFCACFVLPTPPHAPLASSSQRIASLLPPPCLHLLPRWRRRPSFLARASNALFPPPTPQPSSSDWIYRRRCLLATRGR